MDVEVRSQIYLITCIPSGKYYVGQTQTHHVNHGVYRPSGYLIRWKSHVQHALANYKSKGCIALKAAIRKYGATAFTVSLLHTCNLSFGDYFERLFIHEYQSFGVMGYNLTPGGLSVRYQKKAIDRRRQRSEIVIAKSAGSRIATFDMKKVAKYKDKEIALIELNGFHFASVDRNGIRCRLYGDHIKTSVIEFVGRHVTIDEAYSRAKAICDAIVKQQKQTFNTDINVRDYFKKHLLLL